VPLSLPEQSATDQRLIVQAVKQRLGQIQGWLLVFDNAEGLHEVKDYLPQGSSGAVLITSRNPKFGSTAHKFQVEVFERDEAIGFLEKRIHAATRVAGAESSKPQPAAKESTSNALGLRGLSPSNSFRFVVAGLASPAALA
jgi:hypothetical protein